MRRGWDLCPSGCRVQLNAVGQVELKLKTPWRDRTTHLVMSPLMFMQRLAALVPRPMLHRADRPDSGCSRATLDGVRRAKAALSSGCKPRPATAPAGSNRSNYGGNEVVEAFG